MKWTSGVKCYWANPYGIPVYLTNSHKTFNKARKCFGKDEIDLLGCDGMCSSYIGKNGGMTIVIGLFDEAKLDVLVHELSHACFIIMGRVGIKLTAKNNEAYAYLLGHMFEEFTK